MVVVAVVKAVAMMVAVVVVAALLTTAVMSTFMIFWGVSLTPQFSCVPSSPSAMWIVDDLGTNIQICASPPCVFVADAGISRASLAIWETSYMR